MDVSQISKRVTTDFINFANFLVEDELQASQLIIDVFQSLLVDNPSTIRQLDLYQSKVTFYERVFLLASKRRNHFKLVSNLDLSGRAAFYLSYSEKMALNDISIITRTSQNELVSKIVYTRKKVLERQSARGAH